MTPLFAVCDLKPFSSYSHPDEWPGKVHTHTHTHTHTLTHSHTHIYTHTQTQTAGRGGRKQKLSDECVMRVESAWREITLRVREEDRKRGRERKKEGRKRRGGETKKDKRKWRRGEEQRTWQRG